MIGRYLTIATLICTVGGALNGCAGNRGGKVTLQKTLGPGGRAYGKLKNSQLPNGACLDLPERVTALRAEGAGLALHSRDYDLGQITAPARDHRVGFSSDPASRDLRLRRAATGENAPLYRFARTAATLLEAAPLADVLAGATQDACASVTFKNGVKFKVEHGDARSLNLVDPATQERREYVWSPDGLVITVFAPVRLKQCDGTPSPARFERISMRVTWGERVGVVKLAEGYAKLLDLAPSASSAQFQETTKDLAARAATLECAP